MPALFFFSVTLNSYTTNQKVHKWGYVKFKVLKLLLRRTRLIFLLIHWACGTHPKPRVFNIVFMLCHNCKLYNVYWNAKCTLFSIYFISSTRSLYCIVYYAPNYEQDATANWCSLLHQIKDPLYWGSLIWLAWVDDFHNWNNVPGFSLSRRQSEDWLVN